MAKRKKIPAAGRSVKKTDNGAIKAALDDDEKRTLFLKDMEQYAKALAAKKKTDAHMRNVGKTIKADGFTLGQIKSAIEMNDPEGEDRVREQIAQTMQAARWVGSDIGGQLEMFNSPDRTPADDRAQDAGKQASMENKPCKPPHDPSTSQYRAWMKGYAAHQETLAAALGKGKEGPEQPEATH